VRLIGIAGTDGSGKDSLGEMLRDEHGWNFISVTDILRDEATKRGTRLGRDTLRIISAEWRRAHGLGVLIDKAVESNGHKKPLVVASLRNPGEADRVHELDGLVVWVDADPKVRFDRIKNRNRGSEDHVTFDQFLAEEQAQSQHLGDEATLSLSGVKAKADISLENNGNNIESFKTQVRKALADYV
jgi:dephospho-CoA kinase